MLLIRCTNVFFQGRLSRHTILSFFYQFRDVFFSVPMDLDVKMKAVMIGAVFLIVSTLIMFMSCV